MEEKLFFPDTISDIEPGPPLLWESPSRPFGMGFTKKAKNGKLPPLHSLTSKENAAICLHRFGGHELLAVEIMAYSLLAFPEAPKSIRMGIINTLKEEQDHVQLYSHRLLNLGCSFGDFPLYEHFWKHTAYFTDITSYLCAMSLTFEMANLDFAPIYRDAFLECNDLDSAHLMNTILEDEIKHVAFGVSSLKRLHPDSQSLYSTYEKHLPPLITPKRGKGKVFNPEFRKRAHVPSEWIISLQKL